MKKLLVFLFFFSVLFTKILRNFLKCYDFIKIKQKKKGNENISEKGNDSK